jgi:serine/threonine-protein kinase
MQHVRERMPDVRQLRPEVSAALAAVVERATAKDLTERYADDGEMVADLESALALEASRAGSTDGQVTAVLDTLPPETRRRVPFTVRHPRASRVLLPAIAVLVAAGIAVALILGARSGPAHKGKHGGSSSNTKAVLFQLCSSLSCTDAYNPYAKGDISQNNAQSKYAVDGSLTTAWATDHYYGGNLDDKPGVGIYVSGHASVAATEMVVHTTTPGFRAEVYATNVTPDPSHFTGWHHVSDSEAVSSTQTISLKTAGKSYRYYLFWITSLPPSNTGNNYISVNEIQLYR